MLESCGTDPPFSREPTMSLLRCAIALLLSLLLAATLFAEGPERPGDDAKKVTQLEAEVRALRSQVALLKKELADARVTASQPATTRPASESTPDEKPSRTAEAKDKNPVTYYSPLDILRDLPADLRPNLKNGWDKYNFPKVREWLDAEPPTHPYEATLTTTSVTVSRNPYHQVNNNRPDWLVTFHFEGDEGKYFGQTIHHHLSGLYQMEVDAAAARKAGKIPPGAKVHVTGRVAKVNLTSTVRAETHYTFTVDLTDYKLQTPFLDP
jgi:hypothetical protein